MDNQNLSHSRYNCTYHIVFIPKYRRKVMFGKLRREVVEILGKVCKMEGVTILKAATPRSCAYVCIYSTEAECGKGRRTDKR